MDRVQKPTDAAVPEPSAPPKRSLTSVFGVIAMIACGALLYQIVGSNLAVTWSHILSIGAPLVLVPLPFLIALSIDSVAWQRIFATMGRSARFLGVLRVRIASEAWLLSLPTGLVFAESMKTVLFKKVSDIPGTDSVAAILAHRYLLTWTNGIYVLLGCLSGVGMLMAVSQTLGIGAFGLLGLGIIIGLALTATGVLIPGLLSGSAFLESIRRGLSWLPIPPLRRLLDRQIAKFRATDQRLQDLFAELREWVFHGGAWVTLAWMLEAAETWLILTIIGADITFAEALAIETLSSLLRSAAFFIPGGLGVQDLGYVALFQAAGIASSPVIAPAFILIKRLKELFWVVVGHGLTLATIGRWRPTAAGYGELS